MPAFHIDRYGSWSERDRVGQQGDFPARFKIRLDLDDFWNRFPGYDQWDQKKRRTIDFRDEFKKVTGDPEHIHGIESVQRLLYQKGFR